MSGAITAGVVVAGAGIAASAMSASAQSKALGKAGAAQAAQYAETKAALNNANTQARNDLQPYADTGGAANKQLAWAMGLAQPDPKNIKAVVPTTYQGGQSNDPVWEKILAQFNDSHQARFGMQMNRPWGTDADSSSAYANLSKQYQDAKAAEAAGQPVFVGQGEFGALTQDYTPEKYKEDPGYTPMVNDLASLQATPGYQFQLEQGLQSVNNSAAANGSLLSGRQIKAVNDYAQGQASTGYQAAWDRAQQAYNNAFSRDTTNKTNQFSRLQSMTNNGQAAAGGQANASVTSGAALAGASTNYGNTQSSLAMAQGQNQANMYTGMSNAVKSGVGVGMGGFSGGGSGFNLLGQQDNNTGSAGTNNGMVNGATNRFF